jgi:hypothetical protein
MKNKIENIRYANLTEHPEGKIAFEYNNETFLIKESDVMLVGTGELAEKWIMKHYSFLLSPFTK